MSAHSPLSPNRIRDRAPQITAAGLVKPTPVGGVSACLVEGQHPQTPDGMKRFRNTSTRPLGKTGLRPGLAQDGYRDSETTYGSPNRHDGGAVIDCLNTHNARFEIAAKQTKQEVMEPLGRTPNKGTKFPEHMQKEHFAFGVTSNKSENAQKVIYPVGTSGMAPSPQKEAGVQKDRSYNWSSRGINPQAYRFGAVNHEHEPIDLSYAGDNIVGTSTAAHRQLRNGQIGSPKKTGCAPALPDDHAYGVNNRHDTYTMNELLHGVGAPQPDFDGQSTPAYKNPHVRHLKESDRQVNAERYGAERTFGVPSVRTDLSPPKAGGTKITSNTNYGEDPAANQLLYPQPFDQDGLGLKPVTMAEAIALSNKCGFGLTSEQAQMCYKLAMKNSGARQVVSPQSFVAAVTEAGF